MGLQNLSYYQKFILILKDCWKQHSIQIEPVLSSAWFQRRMFRTHKITNILKIWLKRFLANNLTLSVPRQSIDAFISKSRLKTQNYVLHDLFMNISFSVELWFIYSPKNLDEQFTLSQYKCPPKQITLFSEKFFPFKDDSKIYRFSKNFIWLYFP